MDKINGVGIHEDYNIMKCQASIPYIFNTLNKLSIPQMVYREFNSSLFDGEKHENIKIN